jgi:hypothetical protein
MSKFSWPKETDLPNYQNKNMPEGIDLTRPAACPGLGPRTGGVWGGGCPRTPPQRTPMVGGGGRTWGEIDEPRLHFACNMYNKMYTRHFTVH